MYYVPCTYMLIKYEGPVQAKDIYNYFFKNNKNKLTNSYSGCVYFYEGTYIQ